ncbi:hypothetical protein FJZ53_01390 [Candidatus Woesearchaeota archaeon]|nr:hypothetical protein [Candidatus Woesearchaeota archaeon]
MLSDMIEENQKACENVYKEALKLFPYIKEDEMRIDYSIAYQGAADFSISCKKSDMKEGRFDPSIRLGNQFLMLTPNKKRTVMIHEIGHYIHKLKKHPSIERAKRLSRFTNEANFYNSHPYISSALRFLSSKEKHKMGRLQKWFIMKEVYADNKTFEAGYGEHMLELLYMMEPGYAGLPKVFRKEIAARINNLETKLGIPR